MTLYEKLSRKPKQFLACTGMPLHLFEELLPQLADAYHHQEAQRKQHVVRTGQPRHRRPGGGGQFANDVPNRLLMLLLYYRLYLTQEFMTLLFQAGHKSVICRAIHQMRPVFEAVLPTPERARRRILALAKKEQERRKRIGSLDEFRDTYPELTFIIDGTEQPKRKPQDAEKRRSHYSGKRKRHTRKQLVTTTPSGIIVDQSPSVAGRVHDFEVFKADHAARGVLHEFTDYRVSLYGDSGFQGMADLGLPVEVRLMARARRNHPLTTEQQQLNRLRSHTRVRIEHTLSRRKKYRIAAEEYRNRDRDYDPTMNLVAGLVNLRAYDRIFHQTGIPI
ncbi:MAG: transposase [Candidatus Latescibacteria bacterium]|nr:transposase [Candidatus Latescibacterota bacterium]